MSEQLDLDYASPRPMPENFGAKGKRAYFWQDYSWQTGRAWSIDDEGRVLGMCRDYGTWGSSYAGRSPLETHGRWPAEEVRWKKPQQQYEGPRR